MASPPQLHVLRLVMSCRKIAAEVTAGGIAAAEAIVAMASSGEQEFVAESRARLARFPRTRSLWDARTAARVGEKLGHRLREMGVSDVRIDPEEELARPPHYRRPAASLLDSVERAGVRVAGVEKLRWP